MEFVNGIFVKEIKEKKEENLQINARLVSGKWTFPCGYFHCAPKDIDTFERPTCFLVREAFSTSPGNVKYS